MVENLKKLNPLDDDANSFLHNVYCWKVHYVSDRNGLLVLVSVATAIELYVVKVGLFVCYLPFLALYRKTLDLSRFF